MIMKKPDEHVPLESQTIITPEMAGGASREKKEQIVANGFTDVIPFPFQIDTESAVFIHEKSERDRTRV